MAHDPVVKSALTGRILKLSDLPGETLGEVDPVVWYNGAVTLLSLTGQPVEDTDPMVVKGDRLRRLSRFEGEEWAGGGGGGLTASTWNPADKAAGIALSVDLLTATGSGGWQSVRGTLSHPASEGRYFEATRIGANYTGICLANASASLNNYFGSDANGVMFLSNGEVIYGGATIATIGGHGDGNVVRVAQKNGKVWFGVGASFDGDPAAGTGGYSIPGLGSTIFPGFSDVSSNGATFNGGAAGFVHAVPAGFTAWDAA